MAETTVDLGPLLGLGPGCSFWATLNPTANVEGLRLLIDGCEYVTISEGDQRRLEAYEESGQWPGGNRSFEFTTTQWWQPQTFIDRMRGEFESVSAGA